MVTDSASYRRFGAAFTGTRPVVRLGDPGIDAAWLRRRLLGVVAAAAWCVLFPVAFGAGCLSAWGPFGRLDSWQLETFGSNNVILLTILVLPLSFAPLALARLGRIDASTPVRLGMRQAFDARWGPRVEGAPGDLAQRMRTGRRVSSGVVLAGAVALTLFIGKGFHDADAPHAPLPVLPYSRLIDPRIPLARAVRVTGAVADRSLQWAHRYSVRQDVHRDVYFPLRPAHAAPRGPVVLVELDHTSPQYPPAAWNSVDAPGPREGRAALLDDWTAEQLRGAGFPLAPRVVVLKRQQLGGRSPDPDPIDDFIYGLFAFVAIFCGALSWWVFTRAAKLSRNTRT